LILLEKNSFQEFFSSKIKHFRGVTFEPLPMKNALLIFIKNPRLGKVKTRLAATLGAENALKIYLALLERTRQAALQVAADKYLFYSDFVDETDEWRAADFLKKIQRGNDPEYSGQALGERMANAFAEVLPAHEKAIIIGSDLPGLTGEILADAFAKLDHADFVIGQAEDGGYYLLGMKEFQPAVFQEISWSTPLVFEQTIERILSLGKSFATLPVLPDIDTAEDWERHGWQV
ncbi:MAG: TIGR04282 family arsenosugar biosynthesis glycosyltransferase, partial [Bacteroidota bacterium]